MYEQSLEVPIDTIRQEEDNLQDPEVYVAGDSPQVSGRDIEAPRNGQMEMSGERMVSRDTYTEFGPEPPERRQLLGSIRDKQTVPTGHWERRRSSTSEEENLRGVTRGPSLFQESTIQEPEDGNVVPPTSQMTSFSTTGGVQTYGGGPTGPSGITFPSTGYIPRRQTAAGGGGGGDSPPPDGFEDRGDRRRPGGNGGGCGNGNGNGNGDGDENGNGDHKSSISSHKGPQGLQGPQGPMGMQGIQGIQGPLGPQGVPGMVGRQGIQGNRGPQGLRGPRGFQGQRGPAIYQPGVGVRPNTVNPNITTLDISGLENTFQAVGTTMNQLAQQQQIANAQLNQSLQQQQQEQGQIVAVMDKVASATLQSSYDSIFASIPVYDGSDTKEFWSWLHRIEAACSYTKRNPRLEAMGKSTGKVLSTIMSIPQNYPWSIIR